MKRTFNDGDDLSFSQIPLIEVTPELQHYMYKYASVFLMRSVNVTFRRTK